MLRSILTCSVALLVLLFAASDVGAAGPKNCYYRLVGWTPDGTRYAHHMECVGENLAVGNLSKVDDQQADSVELCDTESCPTFSKVARHPRVRALKLRASSDAPEGLSATASVRKGRAWTLTFTLKAGRKTIPLGKRSVGGTRWQLKEVLWEPEGRAVAFSFKSDSARDDRGETLYVLPVPASARPAPSKAATLALPLGLRSGMTMDEALQHLGKQRIKPKKLIDLLRLGDVKFGGTLMTGFVDFTSGGGGIRGVRFVHSTDSSKEARTARSAIKAFLKRDMGNPTKTRGTTMTWVGRQMKLMYEESTESTGAPGDSYRVTTVTFASVVPRASEEYTVGDEADLMKSGSSGRDRNGVGFKGREWGFGSGEGPRLRVAGAERAQVLIGSASVQGGLDGSVVRGVVKRHLDQIHYCYVSVCLARDPKCSGQLKMAFTITPSGAVDALRVVSSTINHGPTQSCAAVAIKRWRFPQTDGKPTQVSSSFIFKNADPKAHRR